jgi:uncharacterized phage protein (TIGR02218 family)
MPRPFDLVTGETFPDKIGPLPWAQAAMGGVFDAADFQVDRAYFASMPTWPMPPGGAVPVGTWTIFAGPVAEVDPMDNSVVMVASDYKSLLSVSAPVDFFGSGCRHTLFDSGCTLSAATFMQSTTAAAGSTQQVIVTSGLTPPVGSSGTFMLGKVTFTAGANAGFSATVSDWDGTNLSLLQQLPCAVATGDAFDVWPGCRLNQADCTAFGNLANYGGEPSIPAPETVT